MYACGGAEDVHGLHLVTQCQVPLLAHGDAVGHGAASMTARLAPCIGCRNDDLGVAPDLVNHGLPPAHHGLQQMHH
eukprot:10732469-Prorocentrum_lima.AAC.1